MTAIESMAAKQERKEYMDTMRRLEHLYGRLCRELYTPSHQDLHRFLRNPNDFGFNFKLKNEEILDIPNQTTLQQQEGTFQDTDGAQSDVDDDNAPEF